jgi:4-hydroxy-3-methylbut-2-enyl diphosphate reductase
MKVVRSKVIGYCFGVSNTINKAEECIQRSKDEKLPCYSIGQLIHNKDVVEHFMSEGMVNSESPDGLEPGIALVRAHGIPESLRRRYENAGFRIVDSTCPIVAKGAEKI